VVSPIKERPSIVNASEQDAEDSVSTQDGESERMLKRLYKKVIKKRSNPGR
jgi:hypothetical protein